MHLQIENTSKKELWFILKWQKQLKTKGKKSGAYFPYPLNLHCNAPIFASWVFVSIKRFNNILNALDIIFGCWPSTFYFFNIGNFIRYSAENSNIHILRTLPIFSLVNRVKGFVLINFTLHCVSAPKLVPTMWFLVWWRGGRPGLEIQNLVWVSISCKLGDVATNSQLYWSPDHKCGRIH